VARIYPDANAQEIRRIAQAIIGPAWLIYTILIDDLTQGVPPLPERDNAGGVADVKREDSNITDLQLANMERCAQLIDEYIAQYEIGEERTLQLLELAHYGEEIRRLDNSITACIEDPRIAGKVKRKIKKIITRVEYTQQMIRALLYWEAISYEEAESNLTQLKNKLEAIKENLGAEIPG
jgi:hypothetical protein